MKIPIFVEKTRVDVRGRHSARLQRWCLPTAVVDIRTAGRRGHHCRRCATVLSLSSDVDFECYFDRDNVPANSDRVQWIARHVPLSVSLASNVPRYETPRCYVTEGDSDKLVADMMARLVATSDAACDLLKPSYESVLDQLKARKEAWDDAESEANAEEDDNEKESKTNPFNTLAGQLHGWLRQLPVIGLNSGKYDLNMIKRSFVPLLISNNAAVIK